MTYFDVLNAGTARHRSAIIRRRVFLTTGVLAIATIMVSGATAQETVGASASSSNSTVVSPAAVSTSAATNTLDATASHVEDIVVTAQRREENLQRVPVSVTALTATTLARSNITTTSGLQQVTPGLTWTASNRTALPYIRGIGSPDISTGSESSVALYVDGIYIESSPASMLALNNIERIEVLKGPQGTLFGRNATGGLIQIITKQPSSTPHLNFDVGYGNYNTLSATGYVTGPITKNVAADLAVIYNNQADGWGRNVYLNRKIDTDKTFGARGKLLFDFDETTFTFGADYTHQVTDIGSERNIVSGRTGRPVFPGAGPTQPLPGYYDSQSNLYPLGRLSTGGVNLHAEHSFDFAKLVSISSYRKTHFDAQLDVDEVSANVLLLQYNSRFKAFTQELQLASQGPGALQWIVGAFYMYRDARQDPLVVGGTSLGFPPFFGKIITVDDVTANVVAPYGQATLKVGSGTELTAGIRYTIERQHFTGVSKGATGIQTGIADVSTTYRKPTWRLAVNQQIGSDLMVYASYNRGFKSGVYNTFTVTDPSARPEVVDAYEIGLKSELLDRRLRVNGAAFQYNYNDIQLAVPTATGSRTINATRARIRGGELSITAVPADRLNLSVGLSYIPTAKYLKFLNAPAYPPVVTGGNSQTSFDDSGGQMIRVAKFTATIGASYTIRVGDGDLDVGGDFYHTSSYIWQVDALARQSPYNVVNTRIGYKLDSGLRASIWVRNLFDRKYQSGLAETASATVYGPAAPRMYGIKFGYSF